MNTQLDKHTTSPHLPWPPVLPLVSLLYHIPLLAINNTLNLHHQAGMVLPTLSFHPTDPFPITILSSPVNILSPVPALVQPRELEGPEEVQRLLELPHSQVTAPIECLRYSQSTFPTCHPCKCPVPGLFASCLCVLFASHSHVLFMFCSCTSCLCILFSSHLHLFCVCSASIFPSITHLFYTSSCMSSSFPRLPVLTSSLFLII